MGKILAWKLGEAIPGRRFHCEPLAYRGDTLERQQGRLDGLPHRPDLLVIYCGHNEFASRYAWSREVEYYLDEKPPTKTRGLGGAARRFSPLCSLMDEVAEALSVATPPLPHARRPLVETPNFTKDEAEARRIDFRRRLDAILDGCETSGIPAVVVIPPANDADFEPSRSFLAPTTPRAERDAFSAEFRALRGREDSDPSGAVAGYRGLIGRHPEFAEAHFRLARLLDRRKLGSGEEAYEHYVAARDRDGMPMRCSREFQEECRKAAQTHHVPVVDGQALFHQIGPNGQLDDHLFHDAMHPTLLGHVALSRAVLEALRGRGVFGWPATTPVPAFDPASCAEHFGLGMSEWRIIAERAQVFYHSTAPLRYDPTERWAKKNAYQEAAKRIAAGKPPEKLGLPNLGLPSPAKSAGGSPPGG